MCIAKSSHVRHNLWSLLEHKIRVTMTSAPQVGWRARPFQFCCETGLGQINMSKPGTSLLVYLDAMLPCINSYVTMPACLYSSSIGFLCSSKSLFVLIHLCPPSPIPPPNYFPEIKNHLRFLCIVKAHSLKLYVPCNALAKKFARVFGEHLIFMNIHPRKEPSRSYG